MVLTQANAPEPKATEIRYLLTFAPLTATPYRDGLRIRRSSLRTNVLLRALTVVPSRNSDARSVMLRIPLPEYADGTLYIVQEAPWDDYDLSASAKITRSHRDDVVAPKLITMPNGISNSRI